MAKSLIERVNTINTPVATKGVGYTGYGDMFGLGGGLDSRNRDLTRSEYGAAQASQLLVEISASLNVWEQWLDGITWHIKDTNTGNTIITTDQRTIPDGAKGSRFFNAIKEYRKRYKHSYWKSIAISDWIAGETYIRRVRNQSNIPTLLQWMNPLATEPMIYSGKIQRYQYSNDDSVDIGYVIEESEIAYRMMRRNLFDDLRGLSPVMSVIDEANLSRNVKRAFRQYFRNGMILGGIISPLNEDATYSERETSQIESMLNRQHRGVDNAHGWVISSRRFFAEQFQSKDTSKDIAILGDLAGTIMLAMGVRDEIVGTSKDITYENQDAALNSWYKLKAIPYAKDIAEYHNNQVIPFLEPNSGIYLEAETSKYEIERPEVVSQDVTASVISLYDAQRKRGQQEANGKLKDIYIVNGRPMSVDVIVKLANTMPSEEVEQLASAEESIANAQAKPIEAQADVVQAEPDVERLALPEPTSEDVLEQKSITLAHGNHDQAIPITDSKAYSHDKALNELKAWKKFRKNDPSRDFAPSFTLGDVADGIRARIADNADLDAVFDSAFDSVRAWQKAVQANRLDYEGDFEELLERAQGNNNFGRVQWSSAVRKINRRYSRLVFVDGLVDGGVTDGELSEDDELALQDHIQAQSQYVTNLGKTLFTDDGNVVTEEMAKQKPSQWYNKSINPAYQLGLLSADKNGMYEWAVGKTEHCSDCLRLNGQRHRMRDWKRKGLLPQSDILECNGFNCKCTLNKVNAKARGTY